MITMAMAADIIVLMVGLELMSLSVYILVGLKRTSPFGAERALKYYIMGAVSSALLLFATAHLYGLTGTTNLAAMGAHFQADPPGPADLLPFVALLFMNRVRRPASPSAPSSWIHRVRISTLRG